MKFVDLFRLAASYRAALIVLTLFTTQAAHAVTWNESYAYLAQGQNLQSTLQAFASAQNLALDINPQIDLAASTGNSWIRGENGPAFLNALAARNNISWFVFERTLYISSSRDIVTKRIILPTGSTDNAREALTAIGLFDARFGWGALPNQGTVLVSGPNKYVALVERFLSMAPAPQPKRSGDAPISNHTLMSFHLRHASVADRVISACNQHNVTPGVASVLRDLLQSRGTPGKMAQTATTVLAPMPVPQSLGAGLIGSLGMSVPTMPESMMATSPPSEPTIVADVRTNTLLIRDLPSRRTLYRQLIKTLDVPLPQIELEALTLEFDDAGRQQLCAQTGLCFSDNREATAVFPKARGANFERALTALLVAPQNTPAGASSLELLMRQRVVTLENQLAALTINRNLYVESTQANPGGTVPPPDNKADAPKRNDANQLCVRPGRLDTGDIVLEIDMALEGWKSMSGMAMEATSQAVLQTQFKLNDDEPILVATSTIGARPGHMRAVVLWAHRRPARS